MPVLIDSNLLIYYFNDISPYAERVEKLIHAGRLAISAITVAEFIVKADETQRKTLDQLLPFIMVEPVDLKIAKTAGSLRKSLILRKAKTLLIDCLIAATAIENNCEFMTANKKDFPFSQLVFAR